MLVCPDFTILPLSDLNKIIVCHLKRVLPCRDHLFNVVSVKRETLLVHELSPSN